MDKKLLEKREDGKYKLIENFYLSSSVIKKIPLKENTQIVKHDGKQYKCIGAYTFPISRPDRENYNERIYSSSLWEKIIKEQKEIWEGAFGLCDHPEGDNDGSVKDAWCVWHSIRMNEDKSLTLADAYLFGKWGEHAQQALEAGAKLGMSSVGYGDFKADGKTIDEDTYELERPADWVLNPSYGVFGNMEFNLTNIEIKKVEDIKDIKDKNIDNDVLLSHKEKTNSIDTKKKENNKMAKQDILLEKNFKWYVESQLKNIEKIESLKEKLDNYKDVLENFQDIDFADSLKEKVKNAIEDVEDKVTKLAEKGKQFDLVKESKETVEKEKSEIEKSYKEMEESYKKLQEKFDTSLIMLDDLKVYTEKLKDLYDIAKAESNGKVSATEYRELSIFSDSLEKQCEDLKKEATKLKHTDKRSSRIIIKRDRSRKENNIMIGRVNKNTILDYYNDLYDNDSGVEVIKEEILKCRTLFEAQKTYLHLKSLYENTPSPNRTHRRGIKTKIEDIEKNKIKENTDADISFSRVKRKDWI